MEHSSFMAGLSWAGPVVARGAAALLAVAPFGWRRKWWHFRTAFYRLMWLAFVVGLLKVALCVTVIASQWTSLSAGQIFGQFAAMVLSCAVAGVRSFFR